MKQLAPLPLLTSTAAIAGNDIVTQYTKQIQELNIRIEAKTESLKDSCI